MYCAVLCSESIQQSDANSEIDEEDDSGSESDDNNSDLEGMRGGEQKFAGGRVGSVRGSIGSESVGLLGSTKHRQGSSELRLSLLQAPGGVKSSSQRDNHSHRTAGPSSRKTLSRKGVKDMLLVPANPSFDVWLDPFLPCQCYLNSSNTPYQLCC